MEKTGELAVGINPAMLSYVTNDDRRSFERFPFSSRLEVRRSHSADHRLPGAFEATALDVSVGGFGFRSTSELSVGEIIAVSMPELREPADLLRAATSNDPKDNDDSQSFDHDPSLRIVAVVRHVSMSAAGEYVIGAERHA